MARDLTAFLQQLASLLDSSADPMSMEEVLEELLDRLRSIVDADTATVLLVEHGSQELVARAARGLEEEVRQGVRVPIGVGFAGSIAATRRPVILQHVDETTVVNPLLWERGLQVMVGVPLISAGTVLGVLHVGRLAHVVFAEDDVDLLLVTAERAVGLIQGRRLETEAAAAQMLERGLQPASLPTVPGLAFAGRYVPASSRTVGGDWYDVFTVPTGALWLVIGDVAGHGLESASVMGRIRNTVRNNAFIGGGPAEVLRLANRQMHHFDSAALVTVLCAAAEPPYTDFELCSAGHLPAALAAPGQSTRLVWPPIAPPLGVLPDIARDSLSVTLKPGSTMLFYTDGLVERTDETIDIGLERLRRAVLPQDPDLICQHVMQSLVGSHASRDDIALLATQREAA